MPGQKAVDTIVVLFKVLVNVLEDVAVEVISGARSRPNGKEAPTGCQAQYPS
jgi:hypothetical protein